MPKKDPAKTKAQIKEDKRIHKERVLKSMKDLLEAGKIDDFTHLFSFYKMTNVAKDIHIGQGTLKGRKENPTSFKINEINAIADLIGVTHELFQKFVNTQIEKMKPHPRR